MPTELLCGLDEYATKPTPNYYSERVFGTRPTRPQRRRAEGSRLPQMFGDCRFVVQIDCCARGRPIIVEWERDARHSAGLSLVRAGAAQCRISHRGGVLLRFGFPNVAEDAPKFASLTRSPASAGGLPLAGPIFASDETSAPPARPAHAIGQQQIRKFEVRPGSCSCSIGQTPANREHRSRLSQSGARAPSASPAKFLEIFIAFTYRVIRLESWDCWA
ncbi:hypothetical protein EVAR_58021_1 [Eumeta japonica]|uniref:Uncharacterized protein n=1 Tax=Eumeta variegata TaxID=151549 RepID=A0A4C2A8A6_EUMVA|nr:hypothetical protein EVAR_58021_1 [Eumeta japonica]